MNNQIAPLTEGTYYILLSLTEPLHGYGIMQKVQEMSNNRVSLAAGTLYGALNALVEKKWIEPLPGALGSRKKEYIITTLGRQTLQQEYLRLTELVENGKSLMTQ